MSLVTVPEFNPQTGERMEDVTGKASYQVVVDQLDQSPPEWHMDVTLLDPEPTAYDDIIGVVDIYRVERDSQGNAVYKLHPEVVDALVASGAFQWPEGVNRSEETKRNWLRHVADRHLLIWDATKDAWRSYLAPSQTIPDQWSIDSPIASRVFYLRENPLLASFFRGIGAFESLGLARRARERQVPAEQIRVLSQCGRQVQVLQDLNPGKKCPQIKKADLQQVAAICRIPDYKKMTVNDLCRAIVDKGQSRLRQFPPEVIEAVIRDFSHFRLKGGVLDTSNIVIGNMTAPLANLEKHNDESEDEEN